MATIPSISLIPSGYKAGKVYSVLPTDGSGDLDFARTTTATRINKNGLIENVGNNVPRLDYEDGGCPSLLLEGSSRNLITYSEAFGNSYWTKSGATIEGDASTVGVELLNDGSITNAGGGVMTFISGGVNAVSDGTSSSSVRPRILWSGLSEGIYKITITPTVNSGSSTFGLYNGTSYEFQDSTIEAKDLYVYNNGSSSLWMALDGTQTFDIDFQFSIKEVQGFSAPSVDSPLGAFKLVEDNVNLSHFVLGNTSTISGNDYTQSVYVKPSGRFLQMTGSTGFNSNWINYDLDNLTMHTSGASSAIGTITLLSNGFCRCTYTDGATSTGSSSRIVIALSNSFTSSRLPSYTGDGTSGVYIFGAQLEQQSYATSYIPTSGSQITRLSETANGAGNASTFNDSEGVLFAEISALADDGTVRSIALSDGNSFNRLNIRFRSQSNEVEYSLFVNGETTKTITHIVSDTTNFHKMAALYKKDDLKFYVNGFLVGSFVSANMLPENTLNQLNFDSGAGISDFYGKTKQLQYFKTALTDLELETLVSYTSFNAMALNFNYTIQ